MQADWTASKNIFFLAYINQPLSRDEKTSQAHCNRYTTKGQGTDKYVCFNEQACLQNVSLRKYGRGATYSFLSLPSSLFFLSLQLRTTLHYLNGRNSLANPPSLSWNPSRTPCAVPSIMYSLAWRELTWDEGDSSLFLSSASGPKLTTLTLVDLPGAHFANDDPRMNQATQSLVLDYIEKNTKSIIVIVSEVGDPTGDSAINLVMRKAKDFRQRTICVLTKPDRLRESDDMGVKVALNKSSFTLEDGRFIVLRGTMGVVVLISFGYHQELKTCSEQLSSTRVMVFSPIILFLEIFWREFRISFKSHKQVRNYKDLKEVLMNF